MLSAFHTARACPFCNAVRPTFAQQREAADAVALCEVVAASSADQASDHPAGERLAVRVRSVLKGKELIARDDRLELPAVERLQPGALCLAWGSRRSTAPADGGGERAASGADREIAWQYLPVTETSYAYFAQSPDLRTAAAERLRYFARFLEHADPTIADDAYLEFGHAPYDVVAQAADSLPLESIRLWLVDENVPQERKGFYGLALGLAREPDARAACAQQLIELASEPSDDFRAGFDGVLGGLLLLTGEEGLDLIDRRYLDNPQSADGHVRSALGALRFYYEYGKEIPRERQQRSLRQLLSRREFAAEAIVDLARRQDWGPLDEIVALYDAPDDRQPGLRRAVVGYLTASPAPQAAAALARLRQRDPRGVSEAEAYLKAFGSLR